MRTRALMCVLCWIFFWSPLSDPDEPGASQREQLETWMKSTGISRDFDILRIGPGPHPALEAQQVLHLELRFKDQSSTQAAESARFRQLLVAYQAEHAATLPQKVFYEFIQVFAVGRREAVVDFHVVEDEYSVYVSPTSSQLIWGEDENRGDPRHFSAAIPIAAVKQQFRTRRTNDSAGSPKQVSDFVEDILRRYFLEANQRKGVPQPDITAVREDGYLGLKVGGLKGLVTQRYWEWVSVNLEINRDFSELHAREPLWKFGCYVSVKYASSPNEKSPTDAEGDYAPQVTNLRDKLIDQLQKELEKGNHD